MFRDLIEILFRRTIVRWKFQSSKAVYRRENSENICDVLLQTSTYLPCVVHKWGNISWKIATFLKKNVYQHQGIFGVTRYRASTVITR